MSERLIEDELAYFLCRLFGREQSESECQQFFIEFLVTFFEDDGGQTDVSGEDSYRMQLSPFNGVYSEYFRDKVVPILKTKGKDHREINFTSHLTEMVNMKHLYKIFERC